MLAEARAVMELSTSWRVRTDATHGLRRSMDNGSQCGTLLSMPRSGLPYLLEFGAQAARLARSGDSLDGGDWARHRAWTVCTRIGVVILVPVLPWERREEGFCSAVTHDRQGAAACGRQARLAGNVPRPWMPTA